MKCIPLVFVLIAAVCSELKTYVIDSGSDIEEMGWDQTGALKVEKATELPNCVPNNVLNLTGEGIWYWTAPQQDCVNDGEENVDFSSAQGTYEDAKSITLNITYFAVLPAESLLYVHPALCKTKECNQLVKSEYSSTAWKVLFVEIEVNNLPITFNGTVKNGEWLLFEKIEINVTYDTIETESTLETTLSTEMVTTLQTIGTSIASSSTQTEATNATLSTEVVTMVTGNITSSSSHTEESEVSPTPAISTTPGDASTEKSEKKTPFYETWWFIAICISIGLIIFFRAIDSQRGRCANCCKKENDLEGHGITFKIQEPEEPADANSIPAVLSEIKTAASKRRDRENSPRLDIYYIPRPQLTGAATSSDENLSTNVSR